MELNSQLVKSFSDEHTVIALGTQDTHNIFKLSPGLCHADKVKVLVNDSELPESSYALLLPSREFKARYNLDSVSAVMLLDNNVRGKVVIKAKPIGGLYQNVVLDTLPMVGKLTDYHGHYLEEFGHIEGLENFDRSFEDLPSRAIDIDGFLLGRVSYPGSGDTSLNQDLEERVTNLEKVTYHSDINIPTINVPGTYVVKDRAKPLIQFESDAHDVTWYTTPEKSEVFIRVNQVSGELEFVDGTVPPGIYAVTLYILSNGVRSPDTLVYLNVL